MQWARLRTAIGVPLRRGGWYRVVSMTELEVVVSAIGNDLTVPRPYVEIRATQPREWTVVRNPTVAPARTPGQFRHGYLVCPSCRERIVLPATEVPKRVCPRCQQEFPIAWGEHYLEDLGPSAEGR